MRSKRWAFYGAVLFALLGVCAGWASGADAAKPATAPSSDPHRTTPAGQDERHSASTEPAVTEEQKTAPQTGLSAMNVADTHHGKTAGAEFVSPTHMAHDFLSDQKVIWSSPWHLKRQDANWLVPFGIGSLTLVAADNDLMRHFGTTPLAHSANFSNYGIAAMMAAAASLYLRGTMTDDIHKSETGLLAGAAAVNSIIVAEALKFASERPRPNARNAGDFGAGGASFPSEHALAAWSIASVVAHEYPGPLTKLLAYGAASGISLARVSAHQHFPSDVIVGSALGYLIGRYVYRAHHNPELPGASTHNFEQEFEVDSGQKAPRPRNPSELGSSYVPLDSWIYAAFDRLAALGYAPSAYADLRPWTRMECVRILVAASDDLHVDDLHMDDLLIGKLHTGDMRTGAPGDGTLREAEAVRLDNALKAEFSNELLRFDDPANSDAENSDLRIESIYTRYLAIAGTPLDDGYHFGQTLINDYGRLYGEGSNVVSGGSASGWYGPFAFYVRGEYQHAAPLPAYSEAVQEMIGTIDQTPPQDPVHTAAVDRFRLLDAYLAWNIKSIEISAGRQSLWWGPGAGGAPNYSDNAEPMDMLRLTNPSPWRLPGFFHWLGPVRWDFFFGLMAGHHYPLLPAIDGQKLSFKPTPNLEFGFSRTIVFRPITIWRFWRGISSFGDNPTTIPGSAADVGDRRGGFDFSYRIPGLRKWMVIYNDGMTDDDTSPLGAPERALMNPGIYLPQIPRLPKLDFRAEVVWSDPPALSNRAGKYVYYNGAYHDAYTNDGHLLGSWVGREGHGVQLWSTYWLSPRSRLQAGYRRAHVDRDFIPQGGNIQDFFVRTTLQLRPEVELGSFLQYERWDFPVIAPLAGPDTVASLEITYHPKWSTALKFPWAGFHAR